MRPGGLTALAIFNFVFGGFAIIGGLIDAVQLSNPEAMEQQRQAAEQLGMSLPSMGVLWALSMFGLLRAGMLIMSGVGYLQLKKFLGRTIGNGYAVLALLGVALELWLFSIGFTVFNLVSFVYPLITLFLLNLIFQRDFVR